MKRRATSADVARVAGVSRTAVSLVLNGRGDGNIAPGTQKAIQAAAAELGYRPNAVAVSLREQRTRTFGVVTDAIATSAFGGDLLQGAMDAARSAGHLLLVMDTVGDPVREAEALQTLIDRRVDGLIFAAMSQREYLPPEPLRSRPSVLANCHDPERQVTSVVADEFGGGRLAAQALVDAGHRRIQILTGTMDVEAGHRRLEGNVAALVDAGLTIADPIECGWEIVDGYRSTQQVLRRPTAERPTAIICPNDRAALGVLLAAAHLGIIVPHELSVIGYDDDINVAPAAVPPLSTIALPHRAIGKVATELLLDQVTQGREPDTRPAESVFLELPGLMVRRCSTAPPPR